MRLRRHPGREDPPPGTMPMRGRTRRVWARRAEAKSAREIRKVGLRGEPSHLRDAGARLLVLLLRVMVVLAAGGSTTTQHPSATETFRRPGVAQLLQRAARGRPTEASSAGTATTRPGYTPSMSPHGGQMTRILPRQRADPDANVESDANANATPHPTANATATQVEVRLIHRRETNGFTALHPIPGRLPALVLPFEETRAGTAATSAVVPLRSSSPGRMMGRGGDGVTRDPDPCPSPVTTRHVTRVTRPAAVLGVVVDRRRVGVTPRQRPRRTTRRVTLRRRRRERPPRRHRHLTAGASLLAQATTHVEVVPMGNVLVTRLVVVVVVVLVVVVVAGTTAATAGVVVLLQGPPGGGSGGGGGSRRDEARGGGGVPIGSQPSSVAVYISSERNALAATLHHFGHLDVDAVALQGARVPDSAGVAERLGTARTGPPHRGFRRATPAASLHTLLESRVVRVVRKGGSQLGCLGGRGGRGEGGGGGGGGGARGDGGEVYRRGGGHGGGGVRGFVLRGGGGATGVGSATSPRGASPSPPGTTTGSASRVVGWWSAPKGPASRVGPRRVVVAVAVAVAVAVLVVVVLVVRSWGGRVEGPAGLEG